MSRDNIRTLQESDGKYSLFFPSAVMAGIGWKKGDKLRIDICGANQLRLSKVIIEEVKPSQNGAEK